MTEYQIGKDIKEMELKFQAELEQMKMLVTRLFEVVEHNLKLQNLTEPVQQSKEQKQ